MNRIVSRGILVALLSGATAYAAAQDATGESVCVVPGMTVLTDAAGDASFQGAVPVPLDTFDLISVQVAQPPQDDGVNRLVFTIKVAGLADLPALPPVASWYTSFKGINGSFYGVRMNTDPTGAVAFQSYSVAGSLDTGDGGISDGRFADNPKAAEAASNYSDDGTITIVVKASDVGASRDGELKQFNAGTVQRVGEESVGGAAFVLDGAPDDLSRRGSVAVAEAPDCAAASKSAPGQFGGALNFALLLPLIGLAGLRRRS